MILHSKSVIQSKWVSRVYSKVKNRQAIAQKLKSLFCIITKFEEISVCKLT